MSSLLKEQILQKSLVSKALDTNELISLLNRSCTDLDDVSDLPKPTAENLNQAYMIKGVHYRCEEVSTGVYDWYDWVTYDTSGQSLHYPDASGKPTLDGITLNGALTKAGLGIASTTASRTEAATLEITDKIPINDDEYTTIDELKTLADEIPLISEYYQKMYLKNDNTLTLTKPTSTTSISLTDTAVTSTIYSLTTNEILKLLASDEIKVGLYTTLTNAAVYLFTCKLLINGVEVSSGSNTITANSSRNDVYVKLSNPTSDIPLAAGSIISLQVDVNRVTFTGTENITIINDANTSAYLYIRKNGLFTNQVFHTLSTSGITLYNNVNKKIDIIVSTYNSFTVIKLNPRTLASEGVSFTDNEHEFIFYNQSGSTIIVTVENDSTLTPTLGSLRAASSISINNGQGAICKYSHVLIGSKMFLVIKQYQLIQ